LINKKIQDQELARKKAAAILAQQQAAIDNMKVLNSDAYIFNNLSLLQGDDQGYIDEGEVEDEDLDSPLQSPQVSEELIAMENDEGEDLDPDDDGDENDLGNEDDDFEDEELSPNHIENKKPWYAMDYAASKQVKQFHKKMKEAESNRKLNEFFNKGFIFEQYPEYQFQKRVIEHNADIVPDSFYNKSVYH